MITAEAGTLDESVVVGDDGGWRSRRAVDFAVDEAHRRGLPVTVLTVSESEPHRVLALPAQRRARPHVVRQLGGRRHATAGGHPAPPDVPLHEVVLVDPSDDALVGCLERAALLVVGAHGGHGRRAFGMGSTSGRLLHASSCPVVVVPEEDRVRSRVSGQPGRVVVGVDDSPGATLALRAAAVEAQRRDAWLQVVHAYARRAGDSDEAAPSVARAVVDRQLALAALGPDVRVTKVLTAEPAVSALAQQASSALLLVIAPRTPMSLSGLVTGSVSLQLLDVVPCPMLLVMAGRVQSPSDLVGTSLGSRPAPR